MADNTTNSQGFTKARHFELMRFARKYGLKGKSLSELDRIEGDIKSGRLQLKPVIKGDKSDSVIKRKLDKKTGMRYLVKEVVMNMPHVMQCAYAKASDNFFIQYLYCKTDLSKTEISQLMGFPVTTMNKKIDKFKWKKEFPLQKIQSIGMLIQTIYTDPGDAIVVPDKEEIKDVDERYRQEFYKLSVRIKQALNQAVPDHNYIKGLSAGASALNSVYHMEREVNGILSSKDERLVSVKEGEYELNKKKFDGGYGDITVIEMGDDYNQDVQALMFLLKETLGEKGLAIDKSDEIMGSLFSKLKKMEVIDED